MEALVPGTVLGSLAHAGLYPQLLQGQRLSQVPTEQFDGPWLYETSVQSPQKRGALLQLQGVSYRAWVLVNGNVVTPEPLVGTFVYHNVPIALESGANAVQIFVERGHDEVFPPSNNSTDLDITFIDWSPTPPDHSMGLIRPVVLLFCDKGPLIQYPVLNTSLSGSDALVEVSVDIFNCGRQSMTVPELHVSLSSVQSAAMASFSLAAGERRLVTFSAIKISQAPLWWPWTMGEPTLSNLTVLSGSKSLFEAQVGIREIVSGVDKDTGFRFYEINGRRVQVRGAGWANELLLRNQSKWSRDSIQLARDAGLNMIRLEGQLLDDAIFNTADSLGVFVVPVIKQVLFLHFIMD